MLVLTVDAEKRRDFLFGLCSDTPIPIWVFLVIRLSMAVLYSTAWSATPFTKPFAKSRNPNFSAKLFSKTNQRSKWSISPRKNRNLVVGSIAEDREVAPVKDKRAEDQGDRLLVDGSDDYNALSTSLSSSSSQEGEGDFERLTSRAINAAIVLGFGTFAVTKLLTIDHDYWQVSDLSNLMHKILFPIFFLFQNSWKLGDSKWVFVNFVKYCIKVADFLL